MKSKRTFDGKLLYFPQKVWETDEYVSHEIKSTTYYETVSIENIFKSTEMCTDIIFASKSIIVTHQPDCTRYTWNKYNIEYFHSLLQYFSLYEVNSIEMKTAFTYLQFEKKNLFQLSEQC